MAGPNTHEFDVGHINDIPDGSHRIVTVSGREIGIYNVGGTLHAVLNACAHALAPICVNGLTGTNLPSGPDEFEYGMEGRVLRCPWHGWEFDVVTGESLFGTDRRRLKTFPVTVVDGRILLTMRSRLARSEASARPAEQGAQDG